MWFAGLRRRSHPRHRWQQLGAPGGEQGEIRHRIRLFQSRSLPLHNALCKGAWGTGEGVGFLFGWGKE